MWSLHCVAKLHCITDVWSLCCVSKLHCITDVTDVGSLTVWLSYTVSKMLQMWGLLLWLLCDDQLFAEVKFLLFVLSFVIELGTEPRVSDVQGKHSATEL